MRILALTLFAVLAFASPAFATQVTDVTVDNSVPTNAAGARTSYVVGFTTFPGWAGGTVSVDATIRGTKWLVQDSCAGTLTRVTQGVVSVRDDVKQKTITLRAGKRYTAKPR
jgi:hypothetical protein